MGDFYIDESIHDRGDFIVIAVLRCGASIQADVEVSLRNCGFIPGRDEFKSSMTMYGNEAAQALRQIFHFLIMEKCNLAIVVCSISERGNIIDLTCRLLRSVIERDQDSLGGVVYFDEGIKFNQPNLPQGWRAELNCDSRKIGGIQLADSAAHVVSTILLSEMGLVARRVSIDGEYPVENGEVELDWQLWASLRYALSSNDPESGYDKDGWCEPVMKPFGLAISNGCSEAVKAAVTKRLGSVWLGCIH